MTVVPLPARGRWVRDLRGGGRAVRVSAHPEAGLVTVSVWRDDACVGSVRLAPGEAAELVAGLTDALAHLVTGFGSTGSGSTGSGSTGSEVTGTHVTGTQVTRAGIGTTAS